MSSSSSRCFSSINFWLARQRRRLISFLLSHVACCQRPSLQKSVLRALERVHDALKMQLLAPLIQQALEGAKSISHDLSVLLIAAIDKTTAKDFNDESCPAWSSLYNAFDAPRSSSEFCAFRIGPRRDKRVNLTIISQLKSLKYGHDFLRTSLMVCSTPFRRNDSWNWA